MRLHKIELYVIDFEQMSETELAEYAAFMLDGIVHVGEHTSVELENFEDEHELNQQSATTEQFRKYFGTLAQG